MKKIGKNSPFKFHCKFCDYLCHKKSHWLQHIVTKKHNDNKMVKNDTKIGTFVAVESPTSIKVVFQDIKKSVPPL